MLKKYLILVIFVLICNSLIEIKAHDHSHNHHGHSHDEPPSFKYSKQANEEIKAKHNHHHEHSHSSHNHVHNHENHEHNHHHSHNEPKFEEQKKPRLQPKTGKTNMNQFIDICKVVLIKLLLCYLSQFQIPSIFGFIR